MAVARHLFLNAKKICFSLFGKMPPVFAHPAVHEMHRRHELIEHAGVVILFSFLAKRDVKFVRVFSNQVVRRPDANKDESALGNRTDGR